MNPETLMKKDIFPRSPHGLRLALFTGKGGVGVSTCSAAYAYGRARHGSRMLWIGSQPGTAASMLFGRRLTARPRRIVSGLWARTIIPEVAALHHMERIRDEMTLQAPAHLIKGLHEQLQAMLLQPGTMEAALFDELITGVLQAEEVYDTVVLDLQGFALLRLLLSAARLQDWYTLPDTSRRSWRSRHHHRPGLLGARRIRERLLARRNRLQQAMSKLSFSHGTLAFVITDCSRLALVETEHQLAQIEQWGPLGCAVVLNKLAAGHRIPAEAAQGRLGSALLARLPVQKEEPLGLHGLESLADAMGQQGLLDADLTLKTHPFMEIPSS
jgi:arsenite-transporting ATPase